MARQILLLCVYLDLSKYESTREETSRPVHPGNSTDVIPSYPAGGRTHAHSSPKPYGSALSHYKLLTVMHLPILDMLMQKNQREAV